MNPNQLRKKIKQLNIEAKEGMEKIDYKSEGLPKFTIKEQHFNFEKNVKANPGVKFYEYKKKSKLSKNMEMRLISAGLNRPNLEDNAPLEQQEKLSLTNYKKLTEKQKSLGI